MVFLSSAAKTDGCPRSTRPDHTRYAAASRRHLLDWQESETLEARQFQDILAFCVMIREMCMMQWEMLEKAFCIEDCNCKAMRGGIPS